MKDEARIQAEFDQYKQEAEGKIKLLEADVAALKHELQAALTKKGKSGGKKDEAPPETASEAPPADGDDAA